VIADHPQAAFGLPESLVGLLPGAGGTQRLPRLIGIEAALPVLLEGARIGASASIAVGLAHKMVPSGEEAAAAERWVLSHPPATQPWDGPDSRAGDTPCLSAIVRETRKKILAETLGHYPAPLAILDCIEQGFPLAFDAAIRAEMEIFAKLIQRREARNMIRTLFLGRLDYERLKMKGMNLKVTEAVGAVSKALDAHSVREKELSEAFARAGFRVDAPRKADFDGHIAGVLYWLEDEPRTRGKCLLRARLADAEAAAAGWRSRLDESERRAADYVLVTEAGFPSYLGGLFAAGLR
jgi:3-hydroxyacyl-CoA dehydrogenase / enoyl-CoA hydratase / 3-hydroxybutyryl-CoA epimerase